MFPFCTDLFLFGNEMFLFKDIMYLFGRELFLFGNRLFCSENICFCSVVICFNSEKPSHIASHRLSEARVDSKSIAFQKLSMVSQKFFSLQLLNLFVSVIGIIIQSLRALRRAAGSGNLVKTLKAAEYRASMHPSGPLKNG